MKAILPSHIRPERGTPMKISASGVVLARVVQRCIIAFAGAMLLLTGSSAHAQTILRVDDDASPGGDGTSWATALQHPQAALDIAAAQPGQSFVIRIAQGRYVPTKRVDPADPRSVTIQLLNGVTLE